MLTQLPCQMKDELSSQELACLPQDIFDIGVHARIRPGCITVGRIATTNPN